MLGKSASETKFPLAFFFVTEYAYLTNSLAAVRTREEPLPPLTTWNIVFTSQRRAKWIAKLHLHGERRTAKDGYRGMPSHDGHPSVFASLCRGIPDEEWQHGKMELQP